jgi:precorrin-2 dehydrogenase / sirohydrochlorin ferrochelatase
MSEPRFLYPMMIGLDGRKAVVVGGGKVALRKAQDLADAGAKVRVVAPELLPEFAKDRRLECVKARYAPEHVAGAFLVIAATDSETVNACVAADAAEEGALVNVVDRPLLCDFIVPAVVKRGRLTVAVSTGGASPSLARRMRERLEQEFGHEYATYLDVMDEVRSEVQTRELSEDVRRRIFERLSEDDLIEAARQGVAHLRQTMHEVIEKLVAGEK